MNRSHETLATDTLESPLGGLLAVFDGAGRLWALDFEDQADRMLRLLRTQRGVVAAPARDRAPDPIRRAFDAYFAGDVRALDALAVHTGGSVFQRRVWAALREIPAGTTSTYGALARRLGTPGASRAVGRGNGSNPIGIAVPCHRVIGASGTLTGYAGGIERKRWLLAHEAEHAPRGAYVEPLASGFRHDRGSRGEPLREIDPPRR
jgi:methylated-DNA-[protein]-cysteine S-methyltransferase